jgi:hypothetical protein
LLSAHSLEYLHVLPGGGLVVVEVVVGTGVVVLQVPALQLLPAPQSAAVEHSFLSPGAVPGGEQSPC